MRTRLRRPAALQTALLSASVLVVAGASVAAHAAPGRPQSAATAEAQVQTATLDLYALEARLARARGALESIASRRATLAREQASVDHRLAVARTAARLSEDRLAELVRAVYQQDAAADPLAIVLGASTIDDAIAGLDDLRRAAARTARIVRQAREARLELRAAHGRLAQRAAELRRLAAGAEAERTAAAAAVAERTAYIRTLRRRHVATEHIATAQARAHTAAERTVSVAEKEDASVVTPAPAALPGSTLVVTSTGYAIHGRTATGMPTGRGVAAVDPAVIPLGTRFVVPGYGEAIAADTGGAVVGNTIDLWFSTVEEAHAWGRQTVTISFP